MDETIFHAMAPAARLRVTGADAAGFLQGQFSNDLRRTPARPATYGLWLNHKGRILADSHVLQHGEQVFEIVSVASPATTIRERLERFIIADDVALEDLTAGCAAVAIVGRGTVDALAALGFEAVGPRQFARVGECVAVPVRLGATSWLVLGPASAVERVQERLVATGVRTGDRAALDRRRIAAGLALVPEELGPDDLPMEGGLEYDALSFTKGCYLGQEVMARLHNLGQVRRRLFVVAVAEQAGVPLRGAALFAGVQRVGEMRAVVPADAGGGAVGLAMLQVHAVGPGTALALEAAGPQWVRVEHLAEGRVP